MPASELKPILRLVPTDSIRFHEHPEHRRTLRLREKIAQDRQLRNPPIVAPMGNEHYLLLDGANRVSAFLQLGYSHCPVQVVDYGDPAVELKGWHHLLLEGGSLDLLGSYRGLSGVAVQPVKREHLGRLLELRQIYGVLVEDSGSLWGVFPDRARPEIEASQRIEVLESLVGAYEGQSRLERVKLADFDQLPQVIEAVEHQVCLYPVLHKEELLHLAADGTMIPTGLTRHVIPGRALGINLDLAFLEEPIDEAEKIRRFKAHVDRLVLDGRIRFYEESVFIMNE